MLDQDLVDPLLRGELAARDLGDVDDYDARRGLVEYGQRSQPVADDHVGGLDGLQTGQGQQPGIARTAADQGDQPVAAGGHGQGAVGGGSDENAVLAGRGDDLLVVLGATAGRDHQLHPHKVVIVQVAADQGQETAPAKIIDGRGDLGADDRDDRAVVEQPADRTECGRAAAADEDATALDLELCSEAHASPR